MMRVVNHSDLSLLHCYVQELPVLVDTLKHETFVSEPIDYLERVFYVPYFIRTDNTYNYQKAENVAYEAARYYIKKMGHPGRGKTLKITIVKHKIGHDPEVEVFTDLCD